MESVSAPEGEQALRTRAIDGDERAYGDLVAPFRVGLHAHCYRMLGSADDADEALQDTLVRAWRGLARFEARSSLRTWLYTIATNVCLTRIGRRARRALPVDMGPASDPHDPAPWVVADEGPVDPYPDGALGAGPAGPAARYEQREAVELAFVAAIQHLPGRQRAVLILRDVLGFSARETAAALDTSVASVTSALQRARKAVANRLPERSQLATLRALGDDRLRRLVERYVDAWERGDAAAILAMLADDATFAMPPYPLWYGGIADIAAWLPVGPLSVRWRVVPISANGQLAFGFYAWDADAGCYVGHSIDVVTLRGEDVVQVVAYLDVDAVCLGRFGLRPFLPADGHAAARSIR